MPIKIHNAQVAVELEASEGTAETLVAADCILAEDPQFFPSVDANERDPVRAGLSPWTSVPGKRSARISFKSWLFGTASAGLTSHLVDVLEACGVDETLSAGVSATYLPETDGMKSATVAVYMDGVKYMIWGARGEASLLLEAGRPGVWTFDFQGADWSKTDEALLVGATYPAVLPPVFMGATLTIGGVSICVSKLQLSFGNNLALRDCSTADSGYVSTLITSRRPTILIDPEDVLVATEDVFGDWKSGATAALACSFGSAAGNTIELTAPVLQYQTVALANRNGIGTTDITALCCMNAGDDEWQIEIT